MSMPCPSYPHRPYYAAPEAMLFAFNDGGRSRNRLRLKPYAVVGDCVVRAVAIATQRRYDDVFAELRYAMRRNGHKPRSPSYGIYTDNAWFEAWMVFSGFQWTPAGSNGPLRSACSATAHSR